MKRKDRDLESFSKQDLIEYIKKSARFLCANEQVIRDLSWIEHDRKFKELDVKMAALEAEMDKCQLPQDWSKYEDLSNKWAAASRAYSRNIKDLA